MVSSTLRFLSTIQFSATDAIIPKWRSMPVNSSIIAKVINVFKNALKTLLCCTIIIPIFTFTYDLKTRKPFPNPALTGHKKYYIIPTSSFVIGAVLTVLCQKSIGSFTCGVISGIVTAVGLSLYLYDATTTNQRTVPTHYLNTATRSIQENRSISVSTEPYSPPPFEPTSIPAATAPPLEAEETPPPYTPSSVL